jgi:DNA-binding XRE family transcriptional regulator
LCQQVFVGLLERAHAGRLIPHDRRRRVHTSNVRRCAGRRPTTGSPNCVEFDLFAYQQQWSTSYSDDASCAVRNGGRLIDEEATISIDSNVAIRYLLIVDVSRLKFTRARLHLRLSRERLHLTQQQLAYELGVHRITLTRWEAGTHRIPKSAAKLVTRMLNEGRSRKGNR